MPLTSEQTETIDQLLKNGKKIAAIKVYREATGLGLKEAKEAIEKIEGSVKYSGELSYEKAQVKGGCFGMIAIGGIVIVSIALRVI